MSASRETERLAALAALLRKWNPAINLVARDSLAQLESRHISDSTQLASLAQGAVGSWADLGSGGGLPGLVVAIHRQDEPVTLVESDQRKSAFLRTAARELGLDNVDVQNTRIEALPPLGVRHVSARALAPLSPLLAYVSHHISPAGTAWLMKGRNWRAELQEAQRSWEFALLTHPSSTSPGSVILEISGLKRYD